MAYQVLARKWRPQNFSSLVGQEPIVTALRNALLERRIAQAYLFSGIRGVGKTTAARVLAKALNCERGPAADPCGECAPCREIIRGADLDVIEVDAATYSKVEQIRDLTESLRYGPARDRYKVVVLDEVHRLSRQAFDALLKIVEEPPPHLVFIFATTEIDAVPATILSRCQEFHFRRVASREVAALLRQICTAEGIEASDTALRLLARAGEGSVRDAVALLDQLATFGSGTVRDDEVVHLLGGLDTAMFRQLLAAILAGDPAAVSGAAARVEDEGWDPRHVYGQFLGFCRDALHLALPPGGGGSSVNPARGALTDQQVDLPPEEAAALAELARSAGYENVLRLLHHLLGSESLVRRSEAGALALEIAWLRAAELPKLIRVEEILAGNPAGRGDPAGHPAAAPGQESPPRPPSSAAGPSPGEPPPEASFAGRLPRPAAAAARAAAGGPADRERLLPATPPPPVQANGSRGNAVVRAERPASPAPRPAAASAAPATGVQSFLEEVSKRKQPLAAHLEAAEELRFSAGRLLIVLPRGDVVLATRLRQPANRQLVSEAVAAVWGAGSDWDFIEGTGAPPAVQPAAPLAASPEETTRGVLQNPTVQTLLDIFGGQVERVEEHGSSREARED